MDGALLWKLPSEVESCGWYGGAIGIDGAIYCAPSRAGGRVLRITSEGVADGKGRAELIGDACQGCFSSVVRGPDHDLYCIPQGAPQVMRIVPSKCTVECIGERFDSLAMTRWGMGVCGSNGKIYCVPRGFGMRVLCIDPVDKTMQLMGHVAPAEDWWSGAVRSRDGRIFCMPANAPQILCIDTESNSTYLVGEHLGMGGFKYSGGVLASDGCIYCCPRGATRVLRFNPEDLSVELFGEDFHGGLNKWVQGVLGPDGCIYCPPADATRVLRIDPLNRTAQLIGGDLGSPGTYKWCSGVLAQNGEIYGVPCMSSDILCLKTPVPHGWMHAVGEPWTPERHRFFRRESRLMAKHLMCLGFQIANSGAFASTERALLNLWPSIIAFLVFNDPF